MRGAEVGRCIPEQALKCLSPLGWDWIQVIGERVMNVMIEARYGSKIRCSGLDTSLTLGVPLAGSMA